MSPASLAREQTANFTRFPGLRKIFSFPSMLGGLLIVLAVLTMRGRFDDPDMWWHLKTGEVIWTSHKVPLRDIFSYTTNHQASVPHEWLSQLFIFGAYRFGGYSGLMLWLCIFTSALLIAGYGLCSLYSGNAKVSFIGALMIWLFGTIGFAIRPHMIGYLLLILEMIVIHLGRTRNPRWFLALPPLFAIWVNCHGSFSLGIVVAVIVLFSSFFDFQHGLLETTRWDKRHSRTMAWAVLFSVGALLLNPVGVRQILYPLNVMLHQPINIGNVQEWQPLQLTDMRGLSLLAAVGCIFLLLAVGRLKLYWDELLLLSFALWLAVSHERMLFVFGILVAPILSRLLSHSWQAYQSEQDRPLANAVLLALSVLCAWLAFPTHQNLIDQVEENNPVKAVEFIKTQNLSGPMLNDWVSGGYLIWNAPEHPDFIDGRGDVFEWSGVLADYEKWATLQSPPDALLDKYKIGFCLVARQSPMAFVFPLFPNWKAVYSDSKYLIFVRVPTGIPHE